MEASRKRCILESAIEAFRQWGFKKASVDAIAQRAGVAKGTIYLCASSKADLFYQAVHEELRNWHNEVSRSIDPRQPADELLRQVVQQGYEFLEKHPLVRDLFYGEYLEILPRWREQFDALRALGDAVGAELLRLGIRQGIFADDLDVEETAALLHDLELAGYAFYSRGATPDQVKRRIEAGLRLVFEGLRVRT